MFIAHSHPAIIVFSEDTHFVIIESRDDDGIGELMENGSHLLLN